MPSNDQVKQRRVTVKGGKEGQGRGVTRRDIGYPPGRNMWIALAVVVVPSL